jgi:anti-anti-sigma factor
MTTSARFEIWRSDGSERTYRIRVAGELDAASGPRLLTSLRQAGQAASRVCLDLTGVTFIDCGGLSALLIGLQEARREGWELEVDQPVSRSVARMLRMAGVNRQLWSESGAQAATSAHT